MNCHLVLKWAVALALGAAPAVVCGQGPMMELDLAGRHIEGTPLLSSRNDVVLLARDGHLWNFRASEATNYRKVGEEFTSSSAADIRGALRSEFGKNFDVSGTAHYLVVHPRGARSQWAPRFEEMYRNYLRYFTARGFEPTRPQFPLIAIVFANEQQFHQYAHQTGAQLVSGTIGYYSPTSNRVLLYDVTEGNVNNPQGEVNHETIVHEAIHQMAFNTGVHSRLSPTPRWVAEGLGTMFEARGVCNSSRYSRKEDRVNQYRLANFQQYANSQRQPGSLAEFVSSDRLFQSNPSGAYGEAWALTFFLFETHPKRYVDYLLAIAARRPFTEYRAPERVADFTRYFGSDLRLLERRYLKFVADLGTN